MGIGYRLSPIAYRPLAIGYWLSNGNAPFASEEKRRRESRAKTIMNRFRIITSSLAISLAGSSVAFAAEAEPDPATRYHDRIRPILEKHCYHCHGAEKQKADLNLASFSGYKEVRAAPEVWQLVLERVQAFEMPPAKEPELDFSKHQDLMKWLRALPKPENPDCDQLASDRNTSFYSGYVMSRRLNRAEYHNTVRDLFGVDLPVQDLLPADGGGGEGFDTAGSALFTSSIHIEKYLAAAAQVLEAVLADGTRKLPPEMAQARAR